VVFDLFSTEMASLLLRVAARIENISLLAVVIGFLQFPAMRSLQQFGG